MSVDNFDVLFAKSLSKGGGGSSTDNYNELSNKPQINGNALTGNKTGANLGLQDAITSESKLSSDLVDDTGAENLFVSSTEKSTWGGKQDPATTLSGYGITDAYTKTEIDTALSGKQNELSQSQLAAANSGITAAKLTADETALGEVINDGAAGTKNIADMSKTSFTTSTSHGVTVSRNGDVFTIDGTSDTNDNIFFNIYYKDLSTNMVPAGDWVASITPTNSEIQLRGGINGSITQFAGYGAPLFLTIPEGTTNNWVRIVAKASTTFNNETFRLMLCRKTLYDVNPDYEPYAPAKTNVEITPALVELVDNGAKNLLKIEAIGADSTTYGTTVTKNGVEYALQADGSIVINRVSSNANSSYIFFRKQDGSTDYITDYMDNEHYLSGITGGSVGTYALFISNYNGQGTSRYIGDPALLTPSSVASNACGISIASGYSPVNLVIRPMICTKSAWDISNKFVPYCPSMAEMYEMILALQNGTRSAPALAKAEPEEVEPETGEEELR